MVECIDSLRLSEAVVDVFLHVEAVHKNERGRLRSIKQFLLERVTILSVVYNYFAISCADEPFIVRFEETDIKRVYSCV